MGNTALARVLIRLQDKAERCHARHPNSCLVVWSATSFQVTDTMLRMLAEHFGIPWHPLICSLF